MGNVSKHPTSNRRHTLLRQHGLGTLACLCSCLIAIGTVDGANPAPAADPATQAASAYRQAMESFNKEEYAHALEQLQHVPEAGKPGEQADVWNLRGAIYLHQHDYAKARVAFSKALEKDPDLWAAKFNLAEVSFRQGKYSESSKQFEDLLGHTSRFTRADERGFLQYKLLLTLMLAGREKSAQMYINEHRGERLAPLMYYYLSAAMERHHGHDRQAEQWLAQGDAHYSPAQERVFAESFRSLGWYTQRSERLIAAARRHDASSTTPASLAVVELIPGQAAPAPGAPNASKTGAPSPAPAAPPKPAFKNTPPPAPDIADQLTVMQMPPTADRGDLPDNQPSVQDADQQAANPAGAMENAADVLADPRAVYTKPIVLGRPSSSPGKGKATPSASVSSSPSASPAGSASASPSGSPAAQPKPDFLEKYEQAYVKFLEKSYPDARKLLDEADAIQPGQTTSINLRAQIFKHYYETAYMAYKQRSDYAEALEQLDEADATQPSQPDALNLRGLTYSKQKDYERAESAFKRAITADPQFWAARFNYAELPFNYRNYTAARTRFEELSGQTDASKQPREAELTQFKIFLTLLLEGKVDGSRSFMQHLSFTGATPARYFCQAALEFYAGNADKAQAEIANANREFQPRLVDIFKESFYRIGWLPEPGSTAVAANGTPPPTAAASAAPAEVAPTSSPATTLVAGTSPSPTPSASQTGPPVAVSTPTSTTAVAEMNSPIPTPDTTSPAPAPGASTALSVEPSATPGTVTAHTDVPTLVPADADASEDKPAKLSRNDNLKRLLLLGVVAITFLLNCFRLLAAVMNHKPRRPVPVRRSPLYASKSGAKQPDELEVPR